MENFRSKKKTMNKGWFKIEEVGKTFYTCSRDPGYIYKAIIPDRIATPEELCLALNKDEHRNWEVYNNSSLGTSILYKEQDLTLDSERVILPCGPYKYKHKTYSDIPEQLVPLVLRNDKATKRPSHHILEEDISAFINGEAIYNKHEIHYKRGYLLYGNPGEGKTTIIRELAKSEMLKNSIIIYCNCVPSKQLLGNLEKYDKDRLKVFIFEELTSVVENDQQAILDFLDGETSIYKMVTIATTNYPEDLPGNIVNRHSRFDKLIEIGSPPTTEIIELVRNFTNITPREEEAQCLYGLSIAAIKEVCLISLLKCISLTRAAEELDSRQTSTKNGFRTASKTAIGFGK